MPEGAKEAENIDTFSPDDYKDKLIEDGYSDESAKMLSEKKRDKLAEQATKGSTAKIEIDLSKL